MSRWPTRSFILLPGGAMSEQQNLPATKDHTWGVVTSRNRAADYAWHDRLWRSKTLFGCQISRGAGRQDALSGAQEGSTSVSSLDKCTCLSRLAIETDSRTRNTKDCVAEG